MGLATVGAILIPCCANCTMLHDQRELQPNPPRNEAPLASYLNPALPHLVRTQPSTAVLLAVVPVEGPPVARIRGCSVAPGCRRRREVRSLGHHRRHLEEGRLEEDHEPCGSALAGHRQPHLDASWVEAGLL